MSTSLSLRCAWRCAAFLRDADKRSRLQTGLRALTRIPTAKSSAHPSAAKCCSRLVLCC